MIISKNMEGKTNSITEIDNCNFTKTILMICVILYHSCLFISDGWSPVSVAEKPAFFLYLSDWLNSFHIYAFTMVSGYIYCYIKTEVKRYDSFATFLLKKVKRLAIPACCLSCIWAAPIGYFLFKYDYNMVIVKYFLGESPNQLWFLWMLFWVFIISFPILDRLSAVITGTIAIILYLGGNFGGLVIPNYFQIWTGCSFVVFFWIGFMFRKNNMLVKLRTIPVLVWIGVDLSIYACTKIIVFENSIIAKATSFSLSFLLNAIGCVMAFIVLQELANRINWKGNRLFLSLSQNTMTIYLLHQQVIFIAIYLFAQEINVYIQFLIYFIVAITIPWIMSIILSKWKVTRIMVGANY